MPNIFQGWVITIIITSLVFFTGKSSYAAQIDRRESQLSVITLQSEQPYSLDSRLTITVVQIVEEWMAPNRRSVMVISLRMQMPDIDQTVQITSDEPVLNWMNYRFEYLGGWRDEVRLRQIEIK